MTKIREFGSPQLLTKVIASEIANQLNIEEEYIQNKCEKFNDNGYFLSFQIAWRPFYFDYLDLMNMNTTVPWLVSSMIQEVKDDIENVEVEFKKEHQINHLKQRIISYVINYKLKDTNELFSMIGSYTDEIGFFVLQHQEYNYEINRFLTIKAPYSDEEWKTIEIIVTEWLREKRLFP